MTKQIELTPEDIELFKKSGSKDMNEAHAAQLEMAKAIELPLREGIMHGDVTGGIFSVTVDGNDEFPTDLLTPGSEHLFNAYTNPGHGYIPQRAVESDFVRITTYQLANAIDFNLKYAKKASWNILERAMEVFEGGFVQKINDDAWATLLAAAADRNVCVFDEDAGDGVITKRLFSLMKVTMKRNGGGNGPRLGANLTDLFLSPEGIEDIRNWDITQLDDTSRREIYKAEDNGAPLTRIYGLTLHDMYEFGEGQVYQDYYLNTLNGVLGTNDKEIIIGLDLKGSKNAFVMPITEGLEVFPDPTLHRQQRQGYYGWMEAGFGVLEGKRVLVGSY